MGINKDTKSYKLISRPSILDLTGQGVPGLGVQLPRPLIWLASPTVQDSNSSPPFFNLICAKFSFQKTVLWSVIFHTTFLSLDKISSRLKIAPVILEVCRDLMELLPGALQRSRTILSGRPLSAGVSAGASAR